MVYGQVLHKRGREEDMVNINVGGVQHKVNRNVLLRFPNTRMGKLLQCHTVEAILTFCDDYNASEQEYYFDRSPHVFRCILNFYHTGSIHVMEELCIFSFNQEMEYWGIQELYLGSCCRNWFQERKDYIEDREWDVRSDEQQPSFDSSLEELSALKEGLEKFRGAWCSEIRRYLWLTLEDPGFSVSAKVIMVASLCVVLTSIVAMCINSMPEFQRTDSNERPIEDPVMAILEVVCIICFSFEFILRLIVAPSVRKFLANPLNVIDFASILPFYATLAFETVDEEGEEESESLENMGKVVQVLRLMRVFRILKLARHSGGLRALGATVRHSYQEVGLLLLFLSVGISIFSVLIYSAEKEDAETDLDNIPVGWWWATITMTTVGYGDTCPVTTVGKMVATVCIICGLLVVALPISIIFNKFSKYYQRNQAMEANHSIGDWDKQPDGIEVPYFGIRDLYVQSMYPIFGGLKFNESSCEDDTNAPSLKNIETDCDADDADIGEPM